MRSLFILLVALYLFKPLFPVVEYVMHYEYIKTNLCVNTEKPKLQCNGKCHLSKQLVAALDLDDTENPFKKNQTKEVDVFIEKQTPKLPLLYFTSENKNTFFYKNNFFLNKEQNTLFKPPICLI